MASQVGIKPVNQPEGINKRRADGRQRPYTALRVLAKVYSILAPVILVIMILVCLAGLTREAPIAEKVGSSIGILVAGSIYYLVMKAISQAIYLLFDIARNTSRTAEEGE